MSASDRPSALRAGVLAALLCALAGCGSDVGPVADAPASDAMGGAGTTASPRATATAANAAPGAAVSSAAADAGIAGTRLLSHPDDLQMVMLGYRLRGEPPPLAQWAAAQQAVRRANEFDRAAVLKAEQQRLQGIYDGIADVGRLRLGVNAQFSEYDSNRGGYYLDAFSPGSVFNFSARPMSNKTETVSVRVDNEQELNFWPLDSAAAQNVLHRNNGRRVTLDSLFRITGVSGSSNGPTIAVRLQRYTIVSTRYQDPAVLGELDFDDVANGE